MKGVLKALKETLFPSDITCDICGRETFGTNICDDCAKTLVFNDGAVCPVCGRRTYRPEICVECKDLPPRFKRAVSAFVYDGGAIALIKKYKEGAGYLKEYFAEEICERLKNFPVYDVIVSVPMTRRAKARRGYDQSELLAEAVAKRTGVPYIKEAAVKRKETGEQKILSRGERGKNLAGCFLVSKKEEIKGKRVLIVDDVLTTGATADELTRVLLRAGAAEAYLATVASVEYKTGK